MAGPHQSHWRLHYFSEKRWYVTLQSQDVQNPSGPPQEPIKRWWWLFCWLLWWPWCQMTQNPSGSLLLGSGWCKAKGQRHVQGRWKLFLSQQIYRLGYHSPASHTVVSFHSTYIYCIITLNACNDYVTCQLYGETDTHTYICQLKVKFKIHPSF